MDYLKEYRQSLLEQGKKVNTINTYLQAVSDFHDFIMKRNGRPFDDVTDLTQQNVEYYRQYLLYITRLKNIAINSKLSALSSYADFMVSIKVIPHNPVKLVERIKNETGRRQPRILDAGDLNRLKSEFYRHGNARDILIFEMLFNTGIQVSELCAVTLDHMTMSEDSGVLWVTRLQDIHRTIPLNQAVRQALTAYLEVRPASADRKLLQGQRGSLGREAVYRIVNKYARQAGIGPISPQILRYQFCARLIEQGVDLVTVADLAGYSTINQIAAFKGPTEKDRIAALEKLTIE